MLDPQERLFLEAAWEAIEDAGYYPETLVQEDESRNIGVFVGAVWAMYQMLSVEERHAGNKTIPNSFSGASPTEFPCLQSLRPQPDDRYGLFLQPDGHLSGL